MYGTASQQKRRRKIGSLTFFVAVSFQKNKKLTGTVHRLKLKLIEKEFQYHFLPKELLYISEIRVGDLGSGKNSSRIRGSKLPVLWIWIRIHLALLDPNSIGNTDPDPGT